MVIWGVFLIDEQFGLELRRFGNSPLKADGLAGILAMPLLHGDFQHLWGNTVSFFSLNALLLYFYRNLGFKVLAWSWLATGCLLWLSGADGNHIGLSGVIYSLSAFLFFSGLIRQAPRLIRVSMVVAFLHGSIVWGVFPIEVGVSWQGHLSGAVVGSFLAIAWRKQGPQTRTMSKTMVPLRLRRQDLLLRRTSCGAAGGPSSIHRPTASSAKRP